MYAHAPAVPDDEQERLAELYRLRILDSPPEERYDRVSRIAQRAFKVPIAYIALVDANRQWFKSRIGLDKQETGRNVSFCGHAILQDDVLVIADTHADERFATNPMVEGPPHTRFYAGAVLRTATGKKVGTLCIMDSEPRRMPETERSILRDLASTVENEFILTDVAALQEKLSQANRQLRAQSEFMRTVFGRYIDPGIAAKLLEDAEKGEIAGRMEKVTVLISDLRGFTSMSEKLPPTETVAALNIYLEAMIDVIGSYGGAVDNIIGDSLVVFFGAPTPAEDDAERAVACGVAMQVAMGGVNERLGERGLPPLSMGIGINTGNAVLGNLGSQAFMKYSGIGPTVNIAARIESQTIGGQVLISHATLCEVRDAVRVDGRLRVKAKGVGSPVAIYDIGAIGGRHNLNLPLVDYSRCGLPD